MGNFRKTIMIDLDGVLNMYDGKFVENKLPELRSGAREFVKKLNENYDLVLFTTRNSLEASKWLIENKIDKYFKDVTNVKTPAYLYLDDRAIGNRMSLARFGLANEDFRHGV